MKLLYNLRNLIFILLGFAIPVSVAFTNFLIIIFTVIWLVIGIYELVIDGDFYRKISYFNSFKWLWSIIGLVLFYFFALFYGDNHDDATYVIQRICLLLFFIPLATSKFTQSTYRYAVLVFLITNLLAAFISIAIKNNIINDLHNYLPDDIISSQSSVSAFLKYNYHNILLSFSCLLSFTLFTKSQSKYSFIYLILILIYSISIFSEAGRAGYLTFNVFFIIYAIYFLKKRIVYSISLVCFLITVNVCSYVNSETYVHRIKTLKHIVQNNGQKKNTKSVEGEIDIRYLFTKESLKLIAKQPFLGYGTGSFISVFSESIDSKHAFKEHKTPHNNFLYIFFEIGFLGLLVFLSLFYFQIKDLISNKSTTLDILILPFFYLFLMLFDSYLFIFTITIFYIFMYTIYKGYDMDKKYIL